MSEKKSYKHKNKNKNKNNTSSVKNYEFYKNKNKLNNDICNPSSKHTYCMFDLSENLTNDMYDLSGICIDDIYDLSGKFCDLSGNFCDLSGNFCDLSGNFCNFRGNNTDNSYDCSNDTIHSNESSHVYSNTECSDHTNTEIEKCHQHKYHNHNNRNNNTIHSNKSSHQYSNTKYSDHTNTEIEKCHQHKYHNHKDRNNKSSHQYSNTKYSDHINTEKCHQYKYHNHTDRNNNWNKYHNHKDRNNNSNNYHNHNNSQGEYNSNNNRNYQGEYNSNNNRNYQGEYNSNNNQNYQHSNSDYNSSYKNPILYNVKSGHQLNYKKNEETNTNIKNLQVALNNITTESRLLKLNSSHNIFSDNIIENLYKLIYTWESIICSIYKYKSGIEKLIEQMVDSVEITPLELDMNFKNFSILINSFINEIIMVSKNTFTNNKNVFSIFVSRNSNNDGCNNIQDNSNIFTHIINKPKKFAYYLNASNTLTLFNIPIFGININDHNNMCMQISRQEESVATTHKYSKIESTFYSLSPNIPNKQEFMRDNMGNITYDEKLINMDKSVTYLNHYYSSIINDIDIYHYPKSDLDKLLNDINSELQKLYYIKKTFSLFTE